MSTLTLPMPSSIRAQRELRAARQRAEARARLRARAEPLGLFILTTALLTALGVRTTVHLHLLYPGALTRLVHAYIAWWNNPPRFRAVGFTYPPLQTVALLPFALLRPLASSMVALPLFSAMCGGLVVASLDRTLVLFDLNWWIRLPLLVVFVANPLFLDYGANGMATCLVMALLAVGLHNFTAWYRSGAISVRSLGFAGGCLAPARLARYETILWLGIIVVAVPLARLPRRAGVVEVLALQAIVLAPIVYIFLIWSGVSTLVGGGGFLSWITRAGAEHVADLNFGGRTTFASRTGGIIDVMWRISPLLLIVPALLILAAVLLRRPMLLLVAAMVIIGAAASVVRMAIAPNAELLQPSYQMVALVPMLIGAGWLISLFPGRREPLARQSGRFIAALGVLAGLLASVATGYVLMKNDGDQYDRAFTYALSSHLQRITPAGGSSSMTNPATYYRDEQTLSLFMKAAVYSKKTVLVDELAFPDLILANDNTVPYRTLAENGQAFWDRILNHPTGKAKVEYLVVANPKLRVPGYPRDLVSRRYPTAYAGHLKGTQVVFRDPVVAVIALSVPLQLPSSSLLPTEPAKLLQLYRDLPALTPTKPHVQVLAPRRIRRHRR